MRRLTYRVFEQGNAVTLAANAKNIEWLIDRMYVARREMQANNVENPVFVLLTKDLADRQAVEDIIMQYFVAQYGDLVSTYANHVESSSPRASIFSLPKIGARIMLLDASEKQ